MTTATRDMYRATLHRDGSVSYWSVTEQVWQRARSLRDISTEDMVARGPEERKRIRRHLQTA